MCNLLLSAMNFSKISETQIFYSFKYFNTNGQKDLFDVLEIIYINFIKFIQMLVKIIC